MIGIGYLSGFKYSLEDLGSEFEKMLFLNILSILHSQRNVGIKMQKDRDRERLPLAQFQKNRDIS